MNLTDEYMIEIREGLGLGIGEQVCDTCLGVGSIDETLGGYYFSNPTSPCPDCDAKGWLKS